MASFKRFCGFVGCVLAGLFISLSAHAECGGNINCIAVSVAPALPKHGTTGLGVPEPPVAFGNQVITTTSGARTILVGAVTRAVGEFATLASIALGGANAAEFGFTTSCTTGAPSLQHNGTATASLGNTCSISVTFSPTTTGAKAAEITVTSLAITRTIPLTGNATPTIPTAQPTTLTVQADAPGSVDLGPLVSGTGILGVSIVTGPATGTVVLNGTVVTYTPNTGFLGTDSFTYQSFSATQTSAPATVTVNVGARADPSQDRNVVGLLGAQAQTAKRFSRAQIGNFQRRMESLHRAAPVGDLKLGDRGPARTAGEPAALSPNALASAGTQPVPASLISGLFSLASTRSLNLSHGTDRAGGYSGDGVSAWIGGNLNFGTRDATGGASALRFTTEGISVGIDRRFSEKLVLGFGLGYAQDRSDIGTDGSKSKSRGRSASLYGSYQPTPNTFVDGLLGYGRLKFDTDRFVAAAGDFARSHRKGDQWFGSLAAGYEHRGNGLLLSPYGRLDFSNDRLHQATETGAGINALTYFEHKLRTLQVSLGLRAESQHQMSLGWVLPRLRVEFRHDLKDDRPATLSFADQFAGPVYSLAPSGSRRNALLVSLGSELLLRDGLRLGADYQVQRLSGAERSQGLRVWLAKDFDGKGLPAGLTSSKLFADPVNVEAAVTWDDNVTRARDAADRLSDHIFSLNVGQSLIFPVTTNSRVVLSGFADGAHHRTYHGLDRFSVGAQGELQYRASGAFSTPTLGIFARAGLDDYRADLRSGHRYSLGATYRQFLTDRMSLFGALSLNGRSAKNAVFGGNDYAARLNLDYSLGASGALYAGGEYRRGDSVSSGGLSAQSAAIAKSTVEDDAFRDPQRIAYRHEAETVIWTFGYNLPLGPRDSIDFSWRHIESSPTVRGTFTLPAGPYGPAGSVTVGKTRYTANQFSAAYLMRF